MTKEELEILIDGKPADIKMRASVLFNAALVTMDDYNKDRSVANLRNMEAAKESLDKFTAEIGGGKAGENFTNVPAIVKYLEEQGWQISDKTLYRHISRDRKLLRQPDGSFTRQSVDKYANAFLKQIATGKRKQDAIDKMQRDKLEEELKNLKLKNEREQFNYDKDKALYVPKAQVDIELATRAGVLISGLKYWIQSKAAEWIVFIGGDTRRVGELITSMTNDLDEHINRYADIREYEVIIEDESTSGVDNDLEEER